MPNLFFLISQKIIINIYIYIQCKLDIAIVRYILPIDNNYYYLTTTLAEEDFETFGEILCNL